jgi:hypothetical protein
VARAKESRKKPKAKAKPAARPPARKPGAKARPATKAAKPKAKPKPKAKGAHAPSKAAPPAKPPAKGAPGKAAPAAPPAAKSAATKAAAQPAAARPGKPDGAEAAAPAPKPEKRKARKSATRRGDYPPGELLLPGGPQGPDEILYLLRGCAAAERPAIDAGVNEIVTKRSLPEYERAELTDFGQGMVKRFTTGTIEPLLPIRTKQTRNFAGIVERAKHRRREIGAFLRGLDLGPTETSHMDSHGEDSLEKLMQWAARLENLAGADEPETANYEKFHSTLDQLDSHTEGLIVDVENTLRRLRDRVRPQRG